VQAVRAAIEGTAKTIGTSLRDPLVKQETEEAGSALMHAVGVSLSELGDRLQRDAGRERERGAA
jgi:hypothetical protein